ncbi:MAG TPA: enoyl-CoA hydratase/isomerase family protein [Pseudonocardia sp.]|nr:enoyl-CoA hydratase/isomerase family protein [Pseudonocardia sp.]
MNTYKCFELDRDADGVLTVRFHSRGGPMTWTADAHREAPTLFAAIAADDANKAVILTGTGDRFIDTPTGYGQVYRSGKVKPSDWERGIWEANKLLHTLLEIRVPVIAAINGPVTGHAEIPLLSDIVLCAEDTYFQDAAHVPNNLIPGDGVHVVWPALLGPNRARYFLLTAEKIHSSEARALGIVAEVLPRDRVLPRARELARKLLETDPLVLRYTRHLLLRPMRRAMADELNVGLGLEAYASVSRFPAFDPDSSEGEN